MTDCLFCRIVLGEVPADLVYSDEDVIAFRDINPVAPVHVLVVPREHIPTLTDAAHEREDLLARVCAVAVRVAEGEGVAESGYRTVVNSGPDAQQSVAHLHLHVIGGRNMGWPPG